MSGHLFIVCAPSGAGKTSLVNALLKADPQVKLSVSYTTRAPRPGEIDGREYHFVDRPTFERMVERGDFLENAQVHGHYYGTSQRWVNEQHVAGHDILLEIDWQGAAQVRKLMPAAVGIFILPPSLEALAQRLQKRAQDSTAVIAQRIAAAREEISHVSEFNYVIINEHFDEAALDLKAIVRALRLQSSTQLTRYNTLINRMK